MAAQATALVDQFGKPMAYHVRGGTGRGGGFEITRSQRLVQNWDVGLSDAKDQATAWELEQLIAYNRDLDVNDPLTKGVNDRTHDNVWGTGLTWRPRPNWKALGRTQEWAAEWARDVEQQWLDYSTNPDSFDAARMDNFASMGSMVARRILVDGGSLLLPLWLTGRETYTNFSLIDVERLSQPNGQTETSRFHDGVEKNRFGGPVRYHISKFHPNDSSPDAAVTEWTAVPARRLTNAAPKFWRRRLIHAFERTRPGQVRGLPWNASLIPVTRLLNQFTLDEVTSAAKNAMIPATLESAGTAEQLTEAFGGSAQYLEERGSWSVDFQSGGIPVLFPGDKLNPYHNVRPSNAFRDFIEMMARFLGAGSSMPLEHVLMDWTNSTYSGARAGLLEAWRSWMCRRQTLVREYCMPVNLLWFEERVARGFIEAPNFYANWQHYTRGDWVGQGRGWIDEEKEAAAAKERINLGISNLEIEATQQGRDMVEILAAKQREFEQRKEFGLVPRDMDYMTWDLMTNRGITPPRQATNAAASANPPGGRPNESGRQRPA